LGLGKTCSLLCLLQPKFRLHQTRFDFSEISPREGSFAVPLIQTVAFVPPTRTTFW
jgi:hypothetical protein